jgi:hypothetical protein
MALPKGEPMYQQFARTKLSRTVLSSLLLFSLLVATKSAYAAAGSLDPTFGTGGVR